MTKKPSRAAKVHTVPSAARLSRVVGRDPLALRPRLTACLPVREQRRLWGFHSTPCISPPLSARSSGCAASCSIALRICQSNRGQPDCISPENTNAPCRFSARGRPLLLMTGSFVSFSPVARRNLSCPLIKYVTATLRCQARPVDSRSPISRVRVWPFGRPNIQPGDAGAQGEGRTAETRIRFLKNGKRFTTGLVDL
jgi:hypothetical protein